jgi:CRISPR-associated protein Csx3
LTLPHPAFKASVVSERGGIITLTIGFGEPADNTIVVPDAISAIRELKLRGGKGIHFNGPAGLPVAMALAHSVAHLFGYVACYDPKLEGYVVSISHNPGIHPGQLLPAEILGP